MKNLHERLVSFHKHKNMDILNYVRKSMLLRDVTKQLEDLSHDVDYLESNMNEADLYLCHLLLNSNIDLDDLNSYYDDLKKKGDICSLFTFAERGVKL